VRFKSFEGAFGRVLADVYFVNGAVFAPVGMLKLYIWFRLICRIVCLGVKDIHLGPTLPAFLSPNVVKVLVDMFHIAGIGSVEDDLKKFGL
jgi:hypothetical protein